MIDGIPEELSCLITIVEGNCWRWEGKHNTKSGRPVRWKGNGYEYIYRVLYRILVGPIPTGAILHHKECEHPWCANPWHTEPMTQSEHVRMHNKVRTRKRRTHCKQGHLLDEANTMVYRKNSTQCRECMKIHGAAYYSRNKEAVNKKSRALQLSRKRVVL